MAYQHLLSAGNIGSLALKNRIVLAAMGSEYAEKDGTCDQRLWDYYEARAKGGAGLLILETTSIAWPAACSMPRMVGFSSDDFIPGLAELAKRVHRHGAKIAAQLNHSGKVATQDVVHGRPVMVPSIPHLQRGDMFDALTADEIATFVKAGGPDGKGPRYHPMTIDDITDVVKSFADAARRARTAGLDAVEIHAGHGYLLSSFLSPHYNAREDEYGGSVENRARLLVEIITAIRAETGSDFPVIVRLDATEFRVDDGITIDAATETARLAAAAGAAAIDVSAYADPTSGVAFTEAPLVHKPGGLLPFAETIRKAVNIPVIAVGRIEPDVGDSYISAGKCDFIAMGRKLLADPELPNKLAAGAEKFVRPCIYCYVCVSKIFLNEPMCCAVNPGTGREQELDVVNITESPQRVAVIGAGPAGLEAARVLALRGHEVTLWERDKDLGGTARIAALAYEPNGRLVTWLENSVRALPVDIRLQATATAEALVADKVDKVVVATGALRIPPELPGKDLDHVFDSDRLRSVLFGGDANASDGLPAYKRAMVAGARLTGITRNIDWLRTLSKIWMPLGKRIVLIGGGLVGLELAEYLAERGRHVTVLEPSSNLGAELSVVRRWRVLDTLKQESVNTITDAAIREITAAGVIYEHEGATHTANADQVIIATGAQTDTRLVDALQRLGVTAIAAGDCMQVGYIEGAMLSARRVAVAL